MRDSLRVSPLARPPAGWLEVPGDKSISHRCAMLAALARGRSVLRGFLRSEDCLNTLRALSALGADVEDRGNEIEVGGTAGRLRTPAGDLDMGNSGTGMRLMCGLLAGQQLTATLTGDESLRSRPMKRIKVPLEKMGARIDLLGGDECAPVRVTGRPLRGIRYESPVASAQVKSAILLAGLHADGMTEVIEPEKTRDHTERLFQWLGFPLTVEGKAVRLTGYGPSGPDFAGREFVVPGDPSSAAFWMVAAATAGGGNLELRNIGMNPERTRTVDVLRRMGCSIAVESSEHGSGGCHEPIGNLRVRGGRLHGTVIEGSEVAAVIDELIVLSVAAALASGETVIRDAAELRKKESDRIRTTVQMLHVFGVDAEERPDGMVIRGGGPVRGGGIVRGYRKDHRIAMSAAVLAMFANAPVTIEDASCAGTSYPGFWQQLGSFVTVEQA